MRRSSRSSARSRRPSRIVAPCASSQASAGSTKAAASVGSAIIGRQARPPLASVSRTIAPASCADPSAAGVLSAETRKLSSSRSHNGPLVGSTSPIVCPGSRAQQLAEREIVGRRRPRHAARLREQPPRQRPGIGVQHPARAVAHVDIGEARLVRSDEPVARADRREIGVDRAIARQHEMIAVVDRQPELGVAIGAAAAARLPRRLAQRHAVAGLRQRDRRRQPRKPRADDMRGALARSPPQPQPDQRPRQRQPVVADARAGRLPARLLHPPQQLGIGGRHHPRRDQMALGATAEDRLRLAEMILAPRPRRSAPRRRSADRRSPARCRRRRCPAPRSPRAAGRRGRSRHPRRYRAGCW